MTTRRMKKWAVLASLSAVAALVAIPGGAGAQTTPQVGVVCTNGTLSGSTRTFDLTTTTGYISLPDGNTMFMWGYAETGKPFQHPSPVLCANQGETVEVVLNNTFAENVSIMLPGQTEVQANGAAAQPEFDGGGNLTSLTTSAAPATSVTYTFLADHPGTFLYESGTSPEKQVRMGLFGALIVRPVVAGVAHPDWANDRPDSQFKASTEFLALLSEIDPRLNQAVANGTYSSYKLENYHARYWLLNGRGYPDSIADNFAPWLPSQPYGALIVVNPKDDNPASSTYNPYPSLNRYLNVGTTDYPFHPHGDHGRVIARDGIPLEGPAAEDLSYEKFVVNIGPGQTWDTLFDWADPDFNPGASVPVTVPDPANLQLGEYYSGSPYLGVQGPFPPGFTNQNQCGEYYIISHNHALFQITSWGVNMTGPITYTKVVPFGATGC